MQVQFDAAPSVEILARHEQVVIGARQFAKPNGPFRGVVRADAGELEQASEFICATRPDHRRSKRLALHGAFRSLGCESVGAGPELGRRPPPNSPVAPLEREQSILPSLDCCGQHLSDVVNAPRQNRRDQSLRDTSRSVLDEPGRLNHRAAANERAASASETDPKADNRPRKEH
jgi:hypothetical protein